MLSGVFVINFEKYIVVIKLFPVDIEFWLLPLNMYLSTGSICRAPVLITSLNKTLVTIRLRAEPPPQCQHLAKFSGYMACESGDTNF